ncbi:uncharacterized protein LOC130854203 [Hippopotamus amphibius kiboko]|uniref:uncharacterized protein LOC130854203 n=1 Tax=Hippopotamus amphibius kiboko TaxID=575201 RepID=UPI002598C352|nr:uncharacterized protein LOC130854203 [Hippopotamus amphibius kiboko]
MISGSTEPVLTLVSAHPVVPASLRSPVTPGGGAGESGSDSKKLAGPGDLVGMQSRCPRREIGEEGPHAKRGGRPRPAFGRPSLCSLGRLSLGRQGRPAPAHPVRGRSSPPFVPGRLDHGRDPPSGWLRPRARVCPEGRDEVGRRNSARRGLAPGLPSLPGSCECSSGRERVGGESRERGPSCVLTSQSHCASSLCGEWIAGRAVWQRRRRLERSGRAEEELLLGAPRSLRNPLPGERAGREKRLVPALCGTEAPGCSGSACPLLRKERRGGSQRLLTGAWRLKNNQIHSTLNVDCLPPRIA